MSIPTAAPGDATTGPDLWSGHSRSLAFWEAAVTVGLVLCAVITVLTTAGIILVLGTQTIAFFSQSKVNPFEFFFGTTLKPNARTPKFGIVPLIWGTFLVAAGSSMIALSVISRQKEDGDSLCRARTSANLAGKSWSIRSRVDRLTEAFR